MWYFNSVRIFVQGYNGSDKQLIARLNPINSGTILHIFGHDDKIIKIKALCVGLTDLNALRNLKSTGTAYTLESPVFPDTDYYLNDINHSLMATTCQSIRTDLPTDAPVFEIDMELYLDE